jgi:hypothetical protein
MRHQHLLLISFCSLLLSSFGTIHAGDRAYSHHTRHLPTTSNSSNSEMIENTANASKDVIDRIVRVVHALLLAKYMNSLNPNFGSLNAIQLALAKRFADASADIWGNATLKAWSFRLHQVLQANTLSDPIDAQAQVYNMICEGSESKNNTIGMLVLSNSVCMTHKCGITPSACLTNSARGNLEDMEELIDGDKEDGERGGFLRRTILDVGNIRRFQFKRFPYNPIQSYTGQSNHVNGVQPSLNVVISGIITGQMPLLEFRYFNGQVSPGIFLTPRVHGPRSCRVWGRILYWKVR